MALKIILITFAMAMLMTGTLARASGPYSDCLIGERVCGWRHNSLEFDLRSKLVVR
jgi:hypothetical protein